MRVAACRPGSLSGGSLSGGSLSKVVEIKKSGAGITGRRFFTGVRPACRTVYFPPYFPPGRLSLGISMVGSFSSILLGSISFGLSSQ